MMQYITLGNLFEQLDYIPKNCPIVLQCRTGLRSPIAASIKEVVNLKGGFLVWKEEGRHSRRPSLLCVIPK